MNGISKNELFLSERSLDGIFGKIRTSTPVKSRLYDVNIENLKTVIEYLTHLKNIKKLTEKEFSFLITRACANFVENEMVLVINKVLVKAVKNLKEIFEEPKDEWR